MRIVIRTDVSAQMGTGHARRCLSLAKALKAMGATVHFVGRRLGINYGQILGDEFAIALLPEGTGSGDDDTTHGSWAGATSLRDSAETLEAIGPLDPNWVIIDHYGYDARWHRAMAEGASAKIAVIDDLADRPIDCDLLIDHNWHHDHAAKYRMRLVRPARILGGPRFAMIDPIYLERTPADPSSPVDSIGVFMGGTDAANASVSVIEALNRSRFMGPVEVATTSDNEHLAELKTAIAAREGATLLLDEPHLADFFLRHALHIGAGGGATWERAYCGVAVIAAVCADNQENVLGPLAERGMFILHPSRPIDPSLMATQIQNLIDDPDQRAGLSRAACGLVDGRGTQRIAEAMFA